MAPQIGERALLYVGSSFGTTPWHPKLEKVRGPASPRSEVTRETDETAEFGAIEPLRDLGRAGDDLVKLDLAFDAFEFAHDFGEAYARFFERFENGGVLDHLAG